MKHVIPNWGKCKSGTFNPKNKEKYKGKYPIIYRSGLELSFMEIIDESSSVLYWSSESHTIPYISPIDFKEHNYYPDFVIEAVNKNGEIENLIVEIKPEIQTSPPKMPKKRTLKTMDIYYRNLRDWEINNAKWKAAKFISESIDYKFVIITEKWLQNKNV